MHIRLLVAAAIAWFAVGTLHASAEEMKAAAQPRKVITWVAPYGIDASWTMLRTNYNKLGPGKGITHLALQFWVPTETGGLARATRYGMITDQAIDRFVKWAHGKGIKVLLCVYNGENDWNWPLAQAGFRDHPVKFAKALVAEMQARKLDGVDVDLEGVGDFEADKKPYVSFVKELAGRVHAKGKIVTVDSFPYIWNAPNQNWWASLFKHADGINSMGYEDLGRNAPSWQSYAYQKSKAGRHASKLQIGLPTYKSEWQGDTTLDQLKWFQTGSAGRVGIALWDAQLQDPSWQTKPVWKVLKSVRNN